MLLQAKLDGELLNVDSGFDWPLIDGVDAYSMTLVLPVEQAERLFAGAKRHGSKLEGVSGDKRKTFEKLTIMGTSPTASPHLRELVLVDRRHVWEYGPALVRRYNVPRKSGGRKRLGADGQPLAIREIVDVLSYQPWSLNNGKPWTAAEILTDLLDHLVPGEWVDRDGVLSGKVLLPEIQDLQIAALPGAALATVLTQLGGRIGLFVRATGQIALIDRLGGGERELLGASKGQTQTRGARGLPRIVGGPLWEEQDRRMERPSAVRCLFMPAAEIRVDHQETAAADAGTTTGAVSPRAYQVLRYPEDVTAGSPARTIVESTWGNLDEFLEFLATQTLDGFPRLTREIFRKGYLRGIEQAYAYVDGSGVWSARGAAIREHYRSTYRLGRPWIDRVSSIRAYRVSVEDYVTGSQGAALVYQDFAEWPTWRGIGSTSAKDPPGQRDMVRNRYANPSAPRGGSIVGTPIASMKAAPAALKIEDEDLGIFSVQFVFDSTGQAARYVPSALQSQRMPSEDPSAKYAYLQEGWLSETHELSAILTVQPAAPNDERLLYPVEVKLEDVAHLLPTKAGRKADGPVLDVIIESSRELARFEWDVSKASLIYAAFDEKQGDGPGVSLADAYGDPVNLPILQAISKAVAARVYASFEDHLEGGLQTGWSPDLEPMGVAKIVSHSIGRDGARTTMDLPPTPPPVSEAPFLPVAIQRMLGGFPNL